MSLTREEVRHIAGLAKITLTPDEEEVFVNQLSSILEYVKQLEEVDTSGLVYGYQVEGLENIQDPDTVLQTDEETRKRLLTLMPGRIGDLLKVKKVFEDK